MAMEHDDNARQMDGLKSNQDWRQAGYRHSQPQGIGSRPVYERDLQRTPGGVRKGRLDYGWERLYEGQGADWRERPAYGWERPGPWWQRGYGEGRPFYGWGRPGQWQEREDYYLQGPYAGRGPKNYRRRDEFIYEDVCEALTRHPDIDASEMEVSVKEGVVTLQGTVNDRHTKRLAEDIVDSVPGVKDIENQLRVRRAQERR